MTSTMADSPLFDAPTCKSKVRDCTRCTVTRTRITNDRKRSSKTMIDENEKIKKKKREKRKFTILHDERASSLGTRRMSRKNMRLLPLAGMSKSYARFFPILFFFKNNSNGVYILKIIPCLLSKGGKITERR